MKLADLWRQEKTRRQALAEGKVVPEPTRYVQCGICSFGEEEEGDD